MSARALLQAAVAARLRAASGLAGAGVFDAPPVRAALPFVQVEEPVLTEWSTKDWAGREARLTLLIHDGGERPARLRALVDAAEAAVLSLPADLGADVGADGAGDWRVVTIRLARSRVARAADRWTAASEFQLRLYAATN